MEHTHFLELLIIWLSSFIFSFTHALVRSWFRKQAWNISGFTRYFLIYFYGDDSEIKFDNQEKPEFKSFDWFELDKPVKKVVYFKKLVYLKVIEYFKKEGYL